MSSTGEGDDNVCANCGIARVDSIKFEECNDCQSVRYCGDKCREQHRKQHEKDCKNFCLRNLIAAVSETWNADRAAGIRDEILFRQPDETHLGECPICFLPMPIDSDKSMFWTCCSEIICMGCVYANYKINRYDEIKARSCPFCRTPSSKSEGETNKKMMKRIKANDPAALSHMGRQRFNEEDYDSAFGYLTNAAELGDAEAHYQLGVMYDKGEGVEKDEDKAVYHYEKAAIGGHPWARHNLACIEEDNGNMERAVKHFIIAANPGDEDSMKLLWQHYSAGNITKEDLEATLRTHQAALDAMKSAQRDAAERACGNIR
jgi:hypothetical protein